MNGLRFSAALLVFGQITVAFAQMPPTPSSSTDAGGSPMGGGVPLGQADNPSAAPDSTPFIRIQSRANVALNFGIVGPNDALCMSTSINPGTRISVQPCGNAIAWNDSHQVQKMAIANFHIYQFDWNGSAWQVTDVTGDLQ